MKTLAYILIGGVAFWAPDILIPAFRRSTAVDAIGALSMTILLPAVLVAVYFVIRRYAKPDKQAPSIALFLGIGVWLLGPLCMMFAWTFVGGGFAKMEGVGYMLLCSVFPPGTFMMSTYDGSLGALVLVSILVVVLHFRYERGHWLMSPRVARLLRRERE